jgi:hypothetical protein
LFRSKRSFEVRGEASSGAQWGDLSSFKAARVSVKAADLTLPHKRHLINRPPFPFPRYHRLNHRNSLFYHHTQTEPTAKHETETRVSTTMPSLLKNTATKSIFDTPEASNQGQTQTNATSSSTTTQQHQQDPYSSTRKPDYDPEVSSVFTQSTLAPEPSSPTSSSRFGFLKRNKSQQQETLLPDTSAGISTETKEKKKSRFENPFKPHVQTDEDRAIMERMRERLGSKEEAIKRGGAGPAGWKGIGGGQAMGGPWTGGM